MTDFFFFTQPPVLDFASFHFLSLTQRTMKLEMCLTSLYSFPTFCTFKIPYLFCQLLKLLLSLKQNLLFPSVLSPLLPSSFPFIPPFLLPISSHVSLFSSLLIFLLFFSFLSPLLPFFLLLSLIKFIIIIIIITIIIIIAPLSILLHILILLPQSFIGNF